MRVQGPLRAGVPRSWGGDPQAHLSRGSARGCRAEGAAAAGGGARPAWRLLAVPGPRPVRTGPSARLLSGSVPSSPWLYGGPPAGTGQAHLVRVVGRSWICAGVGGG